MNDTAISAQNVSKTFKLYKDIIMDPIKEHLLFWRKEDFYREFLAVKDVSFEIQRGQIVGIIGPNGAGKSTLLKMIAGLLDVDKGNIKVHGKITALLTLGLGFHLEFTGRENIFYGGLLLGMSKKEILRKTAGIIEFAEIGDYIDRPLRTFSSGMRARLIFATSMSIDPDILLVDEALATGDSYFVRKCSKRIGEMCQTGATILYVSHNIWHIQQMCHTAFLMDRGEIVAEGEPTSVVSKYHQLVFEKEGKAPLIVENQELKMVSGTGEVVLTHIKIRDKEGKETSVFHAGDIMNIELHYQSFNTEIRELNLLIAFLSCKDSSYVGEMNTVEYMEPNHHETKTETIKIREKGIISVNIEPLLLLNNHYALWIILYEKAVGHVYYSEYKNISPFFVAKSSNPSLKGGALCWLPATITVID